MVSFFFTSKSFVSRLLDTSFEVLLQTGLPLGQHLIALPTDLPWEVVTCGGLLITRFFATVGFDLPLVKGRVPPF